MNERGAKQVVRELPIVRVIAYEDRAEVIREGELQLSGESEIFSLRGLSPLLSTDRIVATARSLTPGATVVVENVRVEHLWIEASEVPAQESPEPELDDASWRQRIDEKVRTAREEARIANDRVVRLDQQRQNLENLTSRYASEVSSVLARGLPVEDKTWEEGLLAFEEALASVHDEMTQARVQADQASREIEDLTGLVAREGTQRMRFLADLHLTLSGDPGRVILSVATVVPCGLWRPAHEAHLKVDPASGQHWVEWSSFATVWQKTGEDWTDVELILSTARPSAGAELPALEADVLQLRSKTQEEKKQIRVEHRHEEVPRQDLAGAAPGVYDGGEARELRPAGRVTICSDGRPHRVAVGTFEAQAHLALVAYPEISSHVFHRASFHNRAGSPLLAGPVTLLLKGSWVGIGDLTFVAEGEEMDLSFGSDDRFTVTRRQRRIREDRRLARDRTHFVSEVDVAFGGEGTEKIELVLRLPKSELKQLRVVASEKWCEPWPIKSDEHGFVRLPVVARPGELTTVQLGFHFDTSGDVVVPNPW